MRDTGFNRAARVETLHCWQFGLLMLLENLLGPVWVFCAFRDIPSSWTVAGGLLLLATLIYHESAGLLGGCDQANAPRALERAKDSGTMADEELCPHKVKISCHNGTAPPADRLRPPPSSLKRMASFRGAPRNEIVLMVGSVAVFGTMNSFSSRIRAQAFGASNYVVTIYNALIQFAVYLAAYLVMKKSGKVPEGQLTSLIRCDQGGVGKYLLLAAISDIADAVTGYTAEPHLSTLTYGLSACRGPPPHSAQAAAQWIDRR